MRFGSKQSLVPLGFLLREMSGNQTLNKSWGKLNLHNCFKKKSQLAQGLLDRTQRHWTKRERFCATTLHSRKQNDNRNEKDVDSRFVSLMILTLVFLLWWCSTSPLCPTNHLASHCRDNANNVVFNSSAKIFCVGILLIWSTKWNLFTNFFV